jgi:hypothetical protein
VKGKVSIKASLAAPFLIISLITASSPVSFGQMAGTPDSAAVHKNLENLKALQADLGSGKPTLAFFYYSVACSCTAARCAIAAAAIDSIPELHGTNDSLNYGSLDSYLVPEGDSLFNLMIMPAVIYFDKDGKEINRLEWGTSREAINMLINHPDVKQVPID